MTYKAPMIAKLFTHRAAVAAALLLLLGSPADCDTFDRLEGDDRVLRLGYRLDARPFSFQETGAPAGYSVALCHAIADAVSSALGAALQTEWIAVEVGDRFVALDDERIDLLCGATTVTESRRAQYDFSILTYRTDGAMLVDAAAFAADAWGVKIGVLRSTSSYDAIYELLTASGDGFAELIEFDARRAAVDAVKSGEIDSFFGDRALLIPYAADEPGRFHLVETSFSREPYALALRRGDTRLLETANEALRALYRSGEISEIHMRWFGEPPDETLRALYEAQLR